MRIFDRIASGESVYVWDGNGNRTADVTVSMRKTVHEAARIVADEAAQYGVEHEDRRGFIHEDFFGPIMPTFPCMWIEWREPKPSQDEIDAIHAVNPSAFAPDRVAIIVEGERRGDYYELRIGPSVLQREGYPLGALLTGIKMKVDQHGRCIEVHRLAKPDAQVAHMDGDYWSPMMPAFQTLGWMNCRNLELEQQGPSAKVRKARAKRNQFPGMDYHVVVIPGGSSSGGSGNGGLGTKLHMVRGHFAVYTPEAPLFGRLVGAYWKPSHVRGNADRGRITSEYHVTAEAAK